MPLGELAVGLDDRFRLLNRGARTARPRQQTPAAVVDWSYDLLFEDERRVLDRLSVFTGGCEIAAARVVCADDEISGDDVAELVTRLADKSLITIEENDADGRVRCRMLQTLVEYGRERLAASGDGSTRASCSRPLLLRSRDRQRCGRARRAPAVVAPLDRVEHGQPASGTRHSRRRDDAESAHRIAGSLGWYWWFTGRALEGSGWLALAGGAQAATAEITRARLLAWTAFTRAPGFVLWADPDEHVPAANARDPEMTSTTSASRPSRSTGRPGPSTSSSGSRRPSPSRTRPAGTTPGRASCSATQNRSSPASTGALGRGDGSRSYPLDARSSKIATSRRRKASVAASHFSMPSVERSTARSPTDTSVGYRNSRGDHNGSITAIEAGLRLAGDLGLTGFVNVLLTDLGASLAAKGELEGARTST